MDILDAASLYEPEAPPPGIIQSSDRDWLENFEGLAIGSWNGKKPSPSASDLLATMDGSALTEVSHWADYGGLAKQNRFGINYPYDFLAVRKQIEHLLNAAGGWVALDDAGKTACVEYFLATDEQRAEVTTDPAQTYELSQAYDTNAQEARRLRVERCRILIFNYVSKPGYEDIFARSAALLDSYIGLGVLGKASGDKFPGILDFLGSSDDFELDGFLETPFQIKPNQPIDRPGLRDAIASLLVDG